MLLFPEKEYLFRTPDAGGTQIYDFVWMVPERPLLDFALKACANAHVALCETPQNYSTNCYEVILGSYGNTVVEIRDKPGVRT